MKQYKYFETVETYENGEKYRYFVSVAQRNPNSDIYDICGINTIEDRTRTDVYVFMCSTPLSADQIANQSEFFAFLWDECDDKGWSAGTFGTIDQIKAETRGSAQFSALMKHFRSKIDAVLAEKK